MISDLFAFSDAAVILIASVLAKYIYLDLYLGAFPALGEYLTIGIVQAVLAVILFKRRGLYEVDIFREGIPFGIRSVFVALFLSFVLLIAFGYLLHVAQVYSRGWIVVWGGLSLIGVVGVRATGAGILRALVRRGYFNRRIAVLGSKQNCRSFVESLGVIGFENIGVFGDSDDDEKGGLSDLMDHCLSNPVDTIVVTTPPSEHNKVARIISEFAPLATHVCLHTDFIGRHLQRAAIRRLGDTNVIEIQNSALVGWNVWLKRGIDICISALALLALAPLFGCIALAIKLDNAGPVFFRQRRHGLNHRIISVAKFRSMTVLEDGTATSLKQATKNDARVTRVGRFLRKTSLDELPQLFNVLVGDMSLVGPRPHALVHNNEYGRIIEHYANRHKVRPGLTGWAQVNGWRGETADPERMKKRVDFDLEYIDTWSAWLDLKIIFWLTGNALLKGENAY